MRKQSKQVVASKPVAGQLTADDIFYLNDINSNTLSQMFGEDVENILSLPVINGSVYVYIPASRRTVKISEQERNDVAAAIAYSTLNQIAVQYQTSDGNLIRVYALGFSNEQIANSGDNYGAIVTKCTPNMYSILN